MTPRAIEDLDGDRRVAIICSGHVSLDIGGPRQFLPEPADAELRARRAPFLLCSWVPPMLADELGGMPAALAAYRAAIDGHGRPSWPT